MNAVGSSGPNRALLNELLVRCDWSVYLISMVTCVDEVKMSYNLVKTVFDTIAIFFLITVFRVYKYNV